MSTSLSTTANHWVSTCTSVDTGKSFYNLNVNGVSVTGWLLGMMPPDALTINGNVYNNEEWSAFGVAELMTWDRAISNTELREVQAYLTSKYGLGDHAPPAPPVPAAPQAAPGPYAASLSQGLMTWYNFDGWQVAPQVAGQPMSQESGTWKSQLNGNTVALSNIDPVVDPPGTAGNSVPISYISGSMYTKVIFPEVYSGMSQMSICTVTRYTSNFAIFRQRIFQPYKSAANWLHGHWSGNSGVAYYSGWLSMSLGTTATKWVSTCSAYNTVAGTYTLDVNGQPVSSTLSGSACPHAASRAVWPRRCWPSCADAPRPAPAPALRSEHP
jgi:hypothetical protein